MKKKIFWGIIAFVASISFVSCGEEDEEGGQAQETSILSQLSDNQGFYDGNTLVLDIYNFLERPDSCLVSTTEGGFYIFLQGEKYEMECEIGYPLLGKTIDLSNPSQSVGNHDLYFTGSDFVLDMFETDLTSMLDGDQCEGSCFSAGSLICNCDSTNLTIDMEGTLKNNKKVALKYTLSLNNRKWFSFSSDDIKKDYLEK